MQGNKYLVALTDMSLSTQHKISKRVEKELHQSKVVIRRLPPDFTEEKLRETLSPLPPHNYFYFAPGDTSLGPFGYSRAYINFLDEALIVPFRDQFDGLILESEKGQKYQVIIEFAPYQGIPKKLKRKPDPRCGTIEQDADFQAFLQSLETKIEPLSSIDVSTYIAEMEASKVSEVQKTPLLAYLEEKRAAKAAKKKVYIESKKKQKSESSKSKLSGKGPADLEGSFKSSKPPKESKFKGEAKARREKMYESDSGTKVTSRSDREDQPRSEASDTVERHGNEPRQYREHGAFVRERRSSDREEKRRGSSQFREERGERRGSSQGESGEGGEREKGRVRNKDRPDKTLYTPRSRETSSKSKESGRSKENYSGEYGKSKQEYSSRFADSRPRSRGDEQGRSKDREQYYSDDYSRRDRRGSNYEERERRGSGYEDREWGKKSRDRDRGRSRDYSKYDSGYDKPKSASYREK